MPNHFHLLIKQIDERSMSRFMQSAITRYVLYFNWKHGRVGSLFQGPYKAAVIYRMLSYNTSAHILITTRLRLEQILIVTPTLENNTMTEV